jgi:hypothetical protein
LTAKIKTVEGQNRRFSKAITVLTDAADARTLMLRFTVEAYSPIVVRPSYRLHLTTFEGTAGRARVVLHRVDGEALRVVEVVAEHQQLLVQARPVTSQGDPSVGDGGSTGLWEGMATRRRPIEAAEGDVWIELSTRETLSPGNMTGTLRLKTNDPQAPDVSLPYTVRVRPLIEARPVAVRMWLSPVRGNEGRAAMVTLRHNAREGFAITGVETSHPQIFVGAAISTGSAARQAIQISLIDGLDAEGFAESVEGRIEVTTDIPGRPPVEIPVIVSPTRALARSRAAARPTATR